MQFKSFGKLLVVSAVVALCACSPLKPRHHGPNDMADANGAQSAGIGNEGGFGGENGTALMAPHNQTYHYAFDDSSIQENDKPSVDAQSKYLANHPNARTLVTGHTDERGSREYNIALGERRAKSVENYMKMNGVRGKQVRTVSYGQEKPVALGHDENSYAQNRRSELTYEATE